jgi:hypothetical protein
LRFAILARPIRARGTDVVTAEESGTFRQFGGAWPRGGERLRRISRIARAACRR